MIRAKLLTTTPNGNGVAPPAYQHIPQDLRDDISEILETEGMMELSAENRILARMDKHQSETLSGIRELQDTLHIHDNRLVLVEANARKSDEVQKATSAEIVELRRTTAQDIGELRNASRDVAELKEASGKAADERRNTARLVKAAIVGSVMSIIIGALVSVYGTRAPVVQEVKEAKQDTAEISTQLKELIQTLKEQKENTPVQSVSPRTRAHQVRRPEPVPGPGAALRQGELITTRGTPLPVISLGLPLDLSVMQFPNRKECQ